MPRPAIALLLALAAGLAAPAAATARSVPPGWLGVTVDGPMTEGAHGTDAEWDLLAASGAEGVRTSVRWAAMQPAAGAAPSFAALDALVLAAARRGVLVLPVVQDTPRWAAARPADGVASPPKAPAQFAAFLRALVGRYGPGGTLWAEHPDVTARPLRQWQLWNEPNLTRYWTRQPFAAGYVRLLRAGRRALRAADPRARVVLAGLPNQSWVALRQIYRAGGRGSFDAVALHPYTGKPKDVVRLVRYSRSVMRAHRDSRLPVWVTELSWPAALGQVPGTAGFETTEAGQAARLKEAVQRLAKARRSLKIERVYWYTWLSREGGGSAFDWSGLRRLRGDTLLSAPSLSAFQAVARQLEGCGASAGAGCG